MGAPLALITNVMIARMLGPAHYGTYLALLSSALIAGAVGVFGSDKVVARELATTARAAQSGRMGYLISWSARFSGLAMLVAIPLMIAFTFAARMFTGLSTIERILAALLVPASGATMIIAAAMLGLGNTVANQVLTNSGKNAALLIGVSLLALAPGVQGTGAVLACQIAAYLASIMAGLAWLRAGTRKASARAGVPTQGPVSVAHEVPDGSLSRASAYFFTSSAAVLIIGRLDVVLVGSLSGSEAAGLFGAANRLIQFSLVGGLVLLSWMQPRYGLALSQAQPRRLQRLWRQGTVAAAVLALVPSLLAWAFAPWLMGLLGPGFSAGVPALRILLAGAVAWGVGIPAGNALLTVTGRERALASITWIQLATTLLLLILLVPHYGASGGALAYAVGLTTASALTVASSITALRAVSRQAAA